MKYIFLQGGPRGPPCFYRREHEAHFKLAALARIASLPRCLPCSMVSRWTNSYIARSCSARKYPANCPNTADLSTKRQPYFEQRGIPTRVLRSEKTYLSCFYHVVTRGRMKGRLSGFPLSAHCAIQRDCKLAPIRAYHKTLPPDTMQYIGIAADEPKRLTRLNGNKTSLLVNII